MNPFGLDDYRRRCGLPTIPGIASKGEMKDHLDQLEHLSFCGVLHGGPEGVHAVGRPGIPDLNPPPTNTNTEHNRESSRARSRVHLSFCHVHMDAMRLSGCVSCLDGAVGGPGDDARVVVGVGDAVDEGRVPAELLERAARLDAVDARRLGHKTHIDRDRRGGEWGGRAASFYDQTLQQALEETLHVATRFLPWGSM